MAAVTLEWVQDSAAVWELYPLFFTITMTAENISIITTTDTISSSSGTKPVAITLRSMVAHRLSHVKVSETQGRNKGNAG